MDSLILVHGIGEQRRFDHLDGQLRYLIRALDNVQSAKAVSVDIAPSNAAAFQAEQNTWGAGPEPSVAVVIRHPSGSRIQESRILVHEVWWADVNESFKLTTMTRVGSLTERWGTRSNSARLSPRQARIFRWSLMSLRIRL
jgi:hypothetical protein